MDQKQNDNRILRMKELHRQLLAASRAYYQESREIMSNFEYDRLYDELLELENPYACPHGRPTIITMSKYELEKKFKRIV